MHKRTRAVIRTGKGRARSTGLRRGPKKGPTKRKPRKVSAEVRTGLSDLRKLNSELGIGLPQYQLTIVRDALIPRQTPIVRRGSVAKRRIATAKDVLTKAVAKANENLAARTKTDMTLASNRSNQIRWVNRTKNIEDSRRRKSRDVFLAERLRSPAEKKQAEASAKEKAITDVARRKGTMYSGLNAVRKERLRINDQDYQTRQRIESVAGLIGYISVRKKPKRKKK